MAHLGRNLLPTWPILRPSWDHLRPNFAKNLRQIAPEISRSAPRDPKTTQGVARGLQDSPWDQKSHGFGVDFGPHFSMFSAVSPSILHGLSASSSRHVAAWRAQRIGYPPPPRSGGRACVDLVSNNRVKIQFRTLRKGSRGSAARAQVAAAACIPCAVQSTFRLKLPIVAHLCPS